CWAHANSEPDHHFLSGPWSGKFISQPQWNERPSSSSKQLDDYYDWQCRTAEDHLHSSCRAYVNRSESSTEHGPLRRWRSSINYKSQTRRTSRNDGVLMRAQPTCLGDEKNPRNLARWSERQARVLNRNVSFGATMNNADKDINLDVW